MKNINYIQDRSILEQNNRIEFKVESMDQNIDSNIPDESFLKMEKFLDQNIKVAQEAEKEEKDIPIYIKLYDGIPVKRVDNQHYTVRFKYNKSEKLKDDGADFVICKNKNSDYLDASVIEKDDKKGEMVIAFFEDVGEIRSCYIKETPYKIYNKISDVLRENKIKILHNSIYSGLYDINNELEDELSEEEKHNIFKLNKSQKDFIKRAFLKKVTYLWGPPGTGKSQVLANLVDISIRRGNRVLILSSTNQAVDSLLDKLKESTPKEVWIRKNSVIRIGQFSPNYAENLKEIRFEEVLKRNIIEENSALGQLDELVLQLNTSREEINFKIEKYNRFEREYINITTAKKRIIERLEDLEIKKEDTAKLESELTAAQNELNKILQRNALLRLFSRKKILHIRTQNEVVTKKYKFSTDQIEHEENELKNLNENLSKSISNFSNYFEFEKYSEEYGLLKETRNDLEKKILHVKDEINKIETRIKQISVELLKEIQVVGATCDSAILKLPQLGEFDLVIIDEASMVSSPKIICNLILSRNRMVISGDFRQLAPISPGGSKNAYYKKFLGRDIFDLVGVIDNIDKGLDVDNLSMLDTQYRYPSVICDFISKSMYKSNLQSSENKILKNESLCEFLSNPIIYIDTSSYEYGYVQSGGNKNFIHRYLIAEIIAKLPTQNSIGVISPFKDQASFYNNFYEKFENIAAGTVHKFQGDGKDVIIFDLVKSWGEGAPYTKEYKSKPTKDMYNFIGGSGPYDMGPRLMNVAMTRAKENFIFVGSKEYIDIHFKNDFIGRASDYLFENGRVINARDLVSINENLENYKAKYNDKFMTSLRTDEVYDYLIDDISLASKMVTIISPFASFRRLSKLHPHFIEALERGIDIKLIMRPLYENDKISDSEIELIRNLLLGLRSKYYKNSDKELDKNGNFSIFFQTDFHQKAVFIDDAIVYRGSMNFLSWVGNVDENVDRFYSSEHALSWAITESVSKTVEVSVTEVFKRMISPKCEAKECDGRQLVYSSKHKKFYCPNCKVEVPIP